MNENKSRHEIDAMQLLEMLLKRWWVIVIAVVLCVGAAFGYTELTTSPTYKSSAELHISGGSSMTSYQQILAGQYQFKTYPYILTAHDTLSVAADMLNTEAEKNSSDKKYSASDLLRMISYNIDENSNIFTIYVTSDDKVEAKEVARVVSEVFSNRTEQITEAVVSSVDTPRDGTQVSSNLKRNILVGFALGAVIGIAVVVLVGIFSDTIDSEDWLMQKYRDEVPLLAVIPDADNNKGKGYYKYKNYYYGRSAKKETKNH